MPQIVVNPGTQGTLGGAGTHLEVKNDTDVKGEYNVNSAGAVPPPHRNVYIFPRTKEDWTVVANTPATVDNIGKTTLIATRY